MWSQTAYRQRGNIYLNAGTHYFSITSEEVYPNKAGKGCYDFSLDYHAVTESFAEKDKGINETLRTASPISLDKTYSGVITIDESADFYQFQLPAKATIRVQGQSGMSTHLLLYDDIGQKVWEKWYYFSSNTIDEKMILDAGTYCIAFMRNGDSTGAYKIKVGEYRLDTPSVSLSNGASGMTVKWKNVSEASGYRIYRKKSGSSGLGTLLKTVDGNVLTYTDAAAVSGTTYTYSVVAYNNSADSKAGTKTYMRMKTPSPKVSNVSAGITVKWSKITGAGGYYVYRKKGSGAWTRIATVSKSTLSYTDKAVKSSNGTSYYYTVKAYNGKYVSGIKSIKMIRLTAVSLDTPSNTSAGKILVKWKKNTAATGYQIQYAASKSFSEAKTVKISSKNTLSKTISGMKKGKTYYVRIRTYRKSGTSVYYSTWSSAKTVKIKK